MRRPFGLLVVLASFAFGSFVAAPGIGCAPAHAASGLRQLVVQLSAGATGEGRLGAASTESRFAALGLHTTRALLDGLGPARSAGLRSAGFAREAALPEVFAFHPERIVLLEAPDSALASHALIVLAADPLVDWAVAVATRSLQMVGLAGPSAAMIEHPALLDTLPNDPMLRAWVQWGVFNIGRSGFYGGVLRADVHALEAWRTSVGDNALKLAYADTGIDPAHPELGGAMPDGSPRIVDAINVTGEFVPVVTDSFGHGTPVAGVMVARANDGAHFGAGGIAGVCGGDGSGNAGCRIVPIKIAPGHSGEASSWDISRAILHATDVGARAMNLSFAGDTPSRLERLALQYAITHGCVVVCAAGNQGYNDPTMPLWPSAYAYDGLCISVGASTPFDERAVFSSYNTGLDLVAPGINVMSTFMTYPSYYGASYNGYVAASGTSFAAPFVTGGVGLLAARRPGLMDDDFQHILRESADDIGAPGVDAQTAHGRMNLGRALDAVRPELGLWHDETVADSFVVEAAGTLTVGERMPGTMGGHLGRPWATRIAAYATVALPDSFLDSVRVWPRVGGTMAVRGNFDLRWFTPFAEVVSVGADRFTLRGFVYRVDEDSCARCDDSFVPMAPSNVRFGFSVLGRVDRPPSLALLAPSPDTSVTPGDTLFVACRASDPDQVTRLTVELLGGDAGPLALATAPGSSTLVPVVVPCLGPAVREATLRVTARDDHAHRDETVALRRLVVRGGACSRPAATFRVSSTVFAGALQIEVPGRGEVRVLDAMGRVVRRLPTRGGTLQWDGRDDHGESARPGIYFVRYGGDAGVAVRRVVRLGG